MTEPQEMILTWDDKVEAIARVATSRNDSDRADFGKVLVAKTNHWVESGQDVKGIVVRGMTPQELSSPIPPRHFSSELAEVARQSNVTLVTAVQMLALYRDLEWGKRSADTLRQALLENKGLLNGFLLSPHLEEIA